MDRNIRFFLLILQCACALFPAVRADYECLCNYNIEWVVYGAATQNSNTVGTMYEFDCKPTVAESEHDGFKKIQIDQKYGFVKMNAQVQVQTCSGNPSPLDIVTATTMPASTTSTSLTSSTMPSTVTTTVTSTPTPTPATSTPSPTTTAPTPTTTAPTPTTTTPRVTTMTSTMVTTSLPIQPVTSPTSTTPLTTPTTVPIATSSTSKLTTPIPQGHVDMCPDHVKTDVAQKGGFLGQYGAFCYQLVDWTRTFTSAEAHCKSLTGTLVSITNQGEQNFVQQLLFGHHFDKKAWIGLNDMHKEGQLVWMSGDPVTFNNFKGDYNQHSTHDHQYNDCFVIEEGGEWLDLPCGLGIGFLNFGEQHPFICQYNISAKLHTLFDILPGIVG